MGRRRYVVRPSVRPLSVNSYFTWLEISLLGGGIWIKLATNIHHVSRHCWKGFQGHGVKGQGHYQTECYIGGGMHFDGVQVVEIPLATTWKFRWLDDSLTRRHDRNSVDNCVHLVSCQRTGLSAKCPIIVVGKRFLRKRREESPNRTRAPQ